MNRRQLLAELIDRLVEVAPEGFGIEITGEGPPTFPAPGPDDIFDVIGDVPALDDWPKEPEHEGEWLRYLWRGEPRSWIPLSHHAEPGLADECTWLLEDWQQFIADHSGEPWPATSAQASGHSEPLPGPRVEIKEGMVRLSYVFEDTEEPVLELPPLGLSALG